jgi:hypothetical protein
VSSPPKLPLELRLGLRSGSVFYFEARELRTTEPHYFAVVNRDPLGQQLLLLTLFTSQLAKVRLRNRERPQTVVEISSTAYPILKVPSAIDCNVVYHRTLGEMVEMIRRKVVRYHRDLPTPILVKIRAAILASPVVDPADKALI